MQGVVEIGPLLPIEVANHIVILLKCGKINRSIKTIVNGVAEIGRQWLIGAVNITVLA